MNKPEKLEGLVIAGAVLNAVAAMAGFLPFELSAKITGGLLALWTGLRFVLRLQGKGEQVTEIEKLKTEMEGWRDVAQSKRAEAVEK